MTIPLKVSLSPKKAQLPAWLRKHKYMPSLLKKLAKKGERNIRRRVMQSAWKTPKAAISISNDLHTVIKKRVVTWYFTKPWASYHEWGVKRQKMKWLVGLNKPIPIKTADQGLIFRWAPRLMSQAWIHPGLKPKHFMTNGIDDTVSQMLSLTEQTLKKWERQARRRRGR